MSWYKKHMDNEIKIAKYGDPVSVFEFMKIHDDQGYDVALMEENPNYLEDDIVIDPDLNPKNYPDMMLSNINNHARVIGKNWYVKFYTDTLRERYFKQQIQK